MGFPGGIKMRNLRNCDKRRISKREKGKKYAFRTCFPPFFSFQKRMLFFYSYSTHCLQAITKHASSLDFPQNIWKGRFKAEEFNKIRLRLRERARQRDATQKDRRPWRIDLSSTNSRAFLYVMESKTKCKLSTLLKWAAQAQWRGNRVELSDISLSAAKPSNQGALGVVPLLFDGWRDHFSFYHEQFFKGVFKSCQIFYPSKVISPKVCSTHLWKHLCWCHLGRWELNSEHTSLLLATIPVHWIHVSKSKLYNSNRRRRSLKEPRSCLLLPGK